MSEIDQYKHVALGIIDCPADYALWDGADPGVRICIYRLEEDAPEDFKAKRGDIILGDGDGGPPAFRIAVPEAFYFFTDWDDWNMDAWSGDYDEVARHFWHLNETFVLGTGFVKRGWHPKKRLDNWLIYHTLAFLLNHYPDEYDPYKGPTPPEEDGSLCRLPTSEEIAGLVETNEWPPERYRPK